MTTQDNEMTWRRAILEVLRSDNEPLHFQEITRRIAERGLRTMSGLTPEATISSMLSRNLLQDGAVDKTGTGTYRYKAPNTGQVTTPASDEIIREAAAEDDFNKVAAYGLYWERDRVLWNPGQGRRRGGLLGKTEDDEQPIDFSNQAGIYVLHKNLIPMYVGRTRAENNALFTRLLDHHTGDRRGARWNQFSWFGFRQIDSNRNLLDSDANVSIGILIAVLESVMIEAFIPPLNDKGGELLGTLYNQVEDPELIARKNDDLLDIVAKAISRR